MVYSSIVRRRGTSNEGWGDTATSYLQYPYTSTNCVITGDVTASGSIDLGTISVATGYCLDEEPFPRRQSFIPPPRTRPWSWEEKPYHTPQIVVRPAFHARSNPRGR